MQDLAELSDEELIVQSKRADHAAYRELVLRYKDAGLSGADQDRYFAETALIAEKLGATEVPKSRAAVEAYLRQVRPQLLYDHRTGEVARALLDHRAASPAIAPFMKLIFQAAQDLLPGWAAQMHGFRIAPVSRPAVRTAARGLGRILRWALTGSVETRARRRAAELGLKPAPAELSAHAQA